MTSAAAMATRLRVKCDCDDIGISLFTAGLLIHADASYYSRAVPFPENCGKLH
jgi:hypothetical protein